MPNRSSTPRSYRRRPKCVFVTIERDPHAAAGLARVLTSAALSRASLEAAARAEHEGSATSNPSHIKEGPAGDGEDPHA